MARYSISFSAVCDALDLSTLDPRAKRLQGSIACAMASHLDLNKTTTSQLLEVERALKQVVTGNPDIFIDLTKRGHTSTHQHIQVVDADRSSNRVSRFLPPIHYRKGL
ncbi:hypothetical protein CC2G_007128 [Coprinopsis cinerea AmutBmut pab1-1]|nr:hypothetical protein CC2G_007128 [Coprinopsis cinerea AmutBmut pab1-1]